MDNNAKLDKWNAVKKSIDTQKIIKKAQNKRIFWVSIGQNAGCTFRANSHFDTKRIETYIGKIDDENFRQIKEKIKNHIVE